MHLPKGLPADTAAAAPAALAPIQKTRPEAKWATAPQQRNASALLNPLTLSLSERGHVNDQDYGAMNALPSLAASSHSNGIPDRHRERERGWRALQCPKLKLIHGSFKVPAAFVCGPV